MIFYIIKSICGKKTAPAPWKNKVSTGSKSISFDTVKSEIQNFIMGNSGESNTNFPFEQ